MGMNLFWLAALIAFAILEAVTVGLASIWFVAGAVAALAVSWLGGQIWLQIAVFLAVSLITLVFFRPLAQKYLMPKTHATNADRVIGQEAVVTEEINNLNGTGAAKVGGVEWTARGEEGQTIAAGSVVCVQRIEGVKLIVREKAARRAEECAGKEPG